jgi:hypothetical protein
LVRLYHIFIFSPMYSVWAHYWEWSVLPHL